MRKQTRWVPCCTPGCRYGVHYRVAHCCTGHVKQRGHTKDCERHPITHGKPTPKHEPTMTAKERRERDKFFKELYALEAIEANGLHA